MKRFHTLISAVALCLAGAAQAQTPSVDNLCPTPATGTALAGQMYLLNWPETEYVAVHEPGMKKVYDKIPPNYMEQLKANPHMLPWGQFAQNRNQETLDRVGGLIRDARAQRLAQALAAVSWTQAQKALAQDAELGSAAQKPRGTALEGAQRDPKHFDWQGVLAKRNFCQLTPVLRVLQPDAAGQ